MKSPKMPSPPPPPVAPTPVTQIVQQAEAETRKKQSRGVSLARLTSEVPLGTSGAAPAARTLLGS